MRTFQGTLSGFLGRSKLIMSVLTAAILSIPALLTTLPPAHTLSIPVAWRITLLASLCMAWLGCVLFRHQRRLADAVAATAGLEKIIDGLSNVLIVTNSEGLIKYCNLAASDLIGMQREALLDQFVYDFVIIDVEKSQESTDLSRLSEAEPVDVSIRNHCGDLIPVFIRRKVSRGLDGKIDGYVFTSTPMAELFEAQKKFCRFSLVDTVTSLPNLVMARNRLAHLMASEKEVELLLIELQRLEPISAVYGIAVGDVVLGIIGERLAEVFRKQFICHLGGGLFVALAVPDDTGNGFSLALQASDVTMHSVRVDDHEFDLGVSIGLSAYPTDGDSFDLLLEHARSAAVTSEDIEGSSIFDEKLTSTDPHWRRSRIELELASACRTSQFHLVYQPQVDLRDSHVVGFEALIRWDHPRWGRLAPQEFIRIAEQSGQIALIDDWVIREVCKQRREFLDEGIWDVPIAINIATTDLSHADFESKLANTLDEYNLAPGFLELELTEKSLSQVDDNAVPVLERLRAFGVRIALDDFGTGYCNLTNLKTLPVDRVKIDREFIRSLPEDKADVLVCKTVVKLARSRRLDVVAEGVETATQAQFLRRIGCDYAQGFLWSPPLDVAALCQHPPAYTRKNVNPGSAGQIVDMEATGIWRASR